MNESHNFVVRMNVNKQHHSSTVVDRIIPAVASTRVPGRVRVVVPPLSSYFRCFLKLLELFTFLHQIDEGKPRRSVFVRFCCFLRAPIFDFDESLSLVQRSIGHKNIQMSVDYESIERCSHFKFRRRFIKI